MRTPTIARLTRPVVGSAVIAAVLLGAPGCAMLRATVGGYETGPNGIARSQQRLRDALVRADFREALGWREDDELLRELNVGVSSYYALQFARSAAVLDSAALLADDRVTASVTKKALALVSNDLARPYEPRRTERLFIPYYGMLAFTRLEQWEDAAVEARRLSALLAQYATDRTDAERTTHATLHYLAGAVFERAGERGEAEVSYRNARALGPPSPDGDEADRASGDGEVLIVVERGFVAHRATESVNIFFGDQEQDSVRGGPYPAQRRQRGDGDDVAAGYWLSMAFPSVRRARRVSGDPAIVVDGASAASSRVVALIDDAASADEARERIALLTRGAARAAAKYVITKAVKDKSDVAGTIANIGASLMERADVRSWHLLPQEITLLRVRAPAGRRTLQLTVGGGAGSERVDVGPVLVRSGLMTITAVRLWQEPVPDVVAVR